MSKHTYFFTHDFNAHQDEKISMVLMELGYEGYGLYWRILEQLAQASEHKLKANVKLLAYTFNYHGDLSKLESLIYDFNLFCLDGDDFYSSSLSSRLNRLAEVKKKRAEAGKKGGIAKALLKQKSSIAKALPEQTSSKPLANSGKRLANSSIEQDRIEQNRIEHDRTEQDRTEQDRIEENRKEENRNYSKNEFLAIGLKNQKELDEVEATLGMFEIWWNSYDKKTGREKTFKKFRKLKKEDQEKCLQVVEKYVQSTPDKMYRKNPLTYLNGSHWEDEIQVPESEMSFGDRVRALADKNFKNNIGF